MASDLQTASKFVAPTSSTAENEKKILIRCGRVVTDFDWEAKNRFNF